MQAKAETDEALSQAQSDPKPKIWTLPFIKIMSINTLVTVCTRMMVTALPLYLLSLGSNESVAGLILGVYTIASVVFRPSCGNLVDSKGRRFVLAIGLVLFTLTCVGFSFTKSVFIILSVRAFQGVAYCATSTSAGALVADVLPYSRMTEGIGYFGMSYNVATAFAPALAIYMINGFSYNSVFLSTGLFSIAGLAMAMTFKSEKKQKAAEQAAEVQKAAERPAVQQTGDTKKLTLDKFVERTALPGAFVMVLIMIPIGMINSFLPEYGLEMGVTSVGLYFTINAITLFTSRLFIGRICDRLGAQKVIPPSLLMIFLGMLCIVFSRTLPMFLVSGVIMGLGTGILNPTIQAYVMKIAPMHRRGAASATYFSANDIGQGIGSILGGILATVVGLSATFFIFAFSAVGGFFVYFFVLRKKIMAEQE